MNRKLLGALLIALLVGVTLVIVRIGHRSPELPERPVSTSFEAPRPPEAQTKLDPTGLLYGRVTTAEGKSYEGRLRFGGREEAFWDDIFNGDKAANPWAVHLTPGQLETQVPIEVFGVVVGYRTHEPSLGRQFQALFGDITRIQAQDRKILVTLKSGTVFELDRFGSDDLGDGLRLWDSEQGLVDLEERQIESLEFLPTPSLKPPASRLFGTVKTRYEASYEGWVLWNRRDALGTDELRGQMEDGSQITLPFASITQVARVPDTQSSRVTLIDGRELLLSGTRQVGDGHRGVYVNDSRYGRVLVSWRAFERIDFSPKANTGPAFLDFQPGDSLTGTVTTRDGEQLTGRLVYDLDESESTETLDASDALLRGVSYNLPFGMVASIELGEIGAQDETSHSQLTLHSGLTLKLLPRSDLGAGNLGMLIFAPGEETPAYVAWDRVQRIDFVSRVPDTSER